MRKLKNMSQISEDYYPDSLSSTTPRKLYLVEKLVVPEEDLDLSIDEFTSELPWYCLLLVGIFVAVPACIVLYKYDLECVKALDDL